MNKGENPQGCRSLEARKATDVFIRSSVCSVPICTSILQADKNSVSEKFLSVFEICSLTALYTAVTGVLLCAWNQLKPLGKCALFRTNKQQTKVSESKTLIPAALEVKIHMTPTSHLYFKTGKQFIHSQGIVSLGADQGVMTYKSPP